MVESESIIPIKLSQGQVRIAIQGALGSFSHLMSTKLFGENIEIDPCDSFKELFEQVKQNGDITKGVIPIENALTGRIGETVKLLIEEENFTIINESFLEINHCLMSNEDLRLEEIEEIYGHPEAISQCNSFLSGLNAKIISHTDGAAALKHIQENNKTALIASSIMRDLFGLSILKENIQDEMWNQTRFLVIEYNSDVSSYDNEILYKTSIILTTNHIPGALYKVLGIFAKNDINLTKLESVPSRKSLWEFNFLIDFEGHVKQDVIQETISELREYTKFVKILGSYPLKQYKENIVHQMESKS